MSVNLLLCFCIVNILQFILEKKKTKIFLSLYLSRPFSHACRKESCQENMHEEGCRLTARIFLRVRARLHLQSDRNNYQSDL